MQTISQLRKVLHLASFSSFAGQTHIYTCIMPYILIKFVCIAHGQTKMATATDEDEETATLVPRSTVGSEVRAS